MSTIALSASNSPITTQPKPMSFPGALALKVPDLNRGDASSVATHSTAVLGARENAKPDGRSAMQLVALQSDTATSMLGTEPKKSPEEDSATSGTAKPKAFEAGAVGKKMGELKHSAKNFGYARSSVRRALGLAALEGSSAASAAEAGVAANAAAESAESTAKGLGSLRAPGTRVGMALRGVDKAMVFKGLDAVLGPAALYYGAKEVGKGVKYLKKGDTALGSAMTVQGGATMASGGAAVAGVLGAKTIAGVASATLAVGAAGVAATADGVKTIIKGAREGKTETVAVGSVKTAAGAAMVAGAASANPVLIVGGALTYGGAVIYENRKELGALAGKAADKVGEFGSAVGGAVTGWVSSGWNSMFGSS